MMQVVHKDLPGIGRGTFKIRFDKNHFGRSIILGVNKLPPAYKAIYTSRFIKTIN